MTPLTLLRACYVLAALATTAVIWLFASGKLYSLFVAPIAESSPAMAFMAMAALIAGGLSLLGLKAAFLFLAWRPRSWGKLLATIPAIGWIFYTMTSSVIGLLLGPEGNDPFVVWTPGVAGVVLLSTAAVHQLVQPRPGLAELDGR